MKKQPDYEKMSVYEQLLEGLKEGVAHARGELNLKTTTLPAAAPALSKTRVYAIRKKIGMSQAVFARYLNVPKKTLQSWEQGARTPKAGEARLLQVFEAAPEEIMKIMTFTVISGTAPKKATARQRAKLRA
ncbi:MAG: helix-turn-helix domain-containing protein [Phycisphaeraceae bacterium]|nr:helix-turn-helix domain-containing protein [Phycisphaeraceae bacterium]